MIGTIRHIGSTITSPAAPPLRWYHYVYFLTIFLSKAFCILIGLGLVLMGIGLLARIIAFLIHFGYCGNF